MRVGLIWALVILAWCSPADAQVLVSGRVVDENAIALAGARVEVSAAAVHMTTVSDSAGWFSVELPAAGEYQVRAEQEGFFVFSGKSIAFHEGQNQLAITLNHLSEFAESIDVVYSPPTIDPQQPDEQKQLN